VRKKKKKRAREEECKKKFHLQRPSGGERKLISPGKQDKTSPEKERNRITPVPEKVKGPDGAVLGKFVRTKMASKRRKGSRYVWSQGKGKSAPPRIKDKLVCRRGGK